ncbi:MAG: J domain-containing protein [Planctomycetota bacterium]|jgi:hypothetical protein
MAQDHYRTLGVRRNASQAEILRAYREAARRCHPDLHPHDEQATGRFYQVQAAWEVLGDPEKRWAYNRSQAPSERSGTAGFGPSDWRDARDACRSLTRYAAAEVAEPALGLAVASALAIGLQYLAFFDVLIQVDAPVADMPSIFSGTLGLLLNLVGCILGVVVLLGAIQMRKLENYRFAVTTSVIAAASCLSPWFLLVVPFGIWALVVLCKQQVRDAFWS